MNKLNIQRDWAALAHEGKNHDVPNGYVYVGLGLKNNDGCLGFGGVLKSDRGSLSTFEGSQDDWHYFCPIDIWEEKTGLIYNGDKSPLDPLTVKSETEIDMKKQNNTFPAKWYIRAVSPELSKIIQNKLFELGFSNHLGTPTPRNLDSEIILNEGVMLDTYHFEDNFKGRYNYSAYREISIPELFTMAPLPKNLVFKRGEFLTGYDVTVTKEKIELNDGGGPFSKEEWLKQKAAIDAMVSAEITVGEDEYNVFLTISHINFGCQKVAYDKWVECSEKITEYFNANP